MSGWRVDFLATVGTVVPDTFWLATEEEAVRLARVLGGFRAVAWFDCEAVGPWIGGKVPESARTGPRSAQEVEVAPSYNGEICGPQIGAEGIGGAA